MQSLRYFDVLFTGRYELVIKWTAIDYFTVRNSRFVSLRFIAIFKTDCRERVILKFKLASWCLSVLTNNRQGFINRKLIVETRTEKSLLYSSQQCGSLGCNLHSLLPAQRVGRERGRQRISSLLTVQWMLKGLLCHITILSALYLASRLAFQMFG